MNRYRINEFGQVERDGQKAGDIYYLASDVEAILRQIMAAASGVSEFHTKEFHRECLDQVRTIAWRALENRTL